MCKIQVREDGKDPFLAGCSQSSRPRFAVPGGETPTPTYPALCARDPRLVKSAVPIRQPDWLPPASTLIGVRASSAPALIGPFLSSLPLSLSLLPPLEPKVTGFFQMSILIGPRLHTSPPASSGLAAFQASEPIGWLLIPSLPNPLLLRAFA